MIGFLNIAVAALAIFGALPEAYRGFKWAKGYFKGKFKKSE